MWLSGFIARRYLLSRKLSTAVNVLTRIAVLGIGLGTAALVLVLSGFNGFHALIQNVFADFDAEVRIVAAAGKYLNQNDSLLRALSSHPAVRAIGSTLETKAVLRYHDRQAVVHLMGVQPAHDSISRVAGTLVVGKYALHTAQNEPMLVLGAGVAAATAANIFDELHPMSLYTLAEGGDLLTAPEQALHERDAFVAGIFSVQKEYDDQYVLASFDLVQDLLGTTGRITAYEMRLHPGSDTEAFVQQWQGRLGPTYAVQDWRSQHQGIYKIMQNEKLAAYFGLMMMLLLIASTIVGNLTMVAVEKRKDIGALQAMGAGVGTVRNIFYTEGLLIGLLAGGGGAVLGGVLAGLQHQYGLLKIQGGEEFLVDAFPMQLQLSDLLGVVATVLALALLSSVYPAWRATRASVVDSLRK